MVENLRIGDIVVVSRGLPTQRTGRIVGITDSRGSQGMCDTHDDVGDPHDFHMGDDTAFDLLKEQVGVPSETQTIFWIDFDKSGTRAPLGNDAVTEADDGEAMLFVCGEPY